MLMIYVSSDEPGHSGKISADVPARYLPASRTEHVC